LKPPLPGARCAEELQGTHPEHKIKPEIVQTQSWRYNTIVVIQRQQQTTISKKVSSWSVAELMTKRYSRFFFVRLRFPEIYFALKLVCLRCELKS